MSRDRLAPSLFAANDLLLSLLACLLVAAFLISAQKKPTPTDPQNDRTAGNISISIWWPQGDTDIDLHMLDPNAEHIYFSRRAGKVLNLLRDDLGNTNDMTSQNFENAYGRGLAPGEYAINVQMYRNYAKFPVEVEAELRIQPELKAGSATTFTARATLDRLGDEATLFRFSIDNDGKLVPGSVHSQFIPLAREGK
jgi:hypothetical protein